MDIHYLKINGVDYPACFSMAATEDIVKEFGGMDAMSSALIERDVTTVGAMLRILISAGIEFCELTGKEHPEMPKGRLTALLGVQETADIVKDIFDLMTADAEREVEVQSKN